jgi:hypothetical protein
MKLPTLALASVLALGSSLAFAQGGGGGGSGGGSGGASSGSSAALGDSRKRVERSLTR